MLQRMVVLLILIVFLIGDDKLAWPQGSGGANIFQGYLKPVAIPDFSLEDLQGDTVQIKNFRGKVVLLHFWATW